MKSQQKTKIKYPLKKQGLLPILFLLLALAAGAWLFVREVSNLLWTNSIRTITESAHQGANALNIQLETDFEELNTLGQNIAQAEYSVLEDMLNLYNTAEPDVKVYIKGGLCLRKNTQPDQTVCDFLEKTVLRKGILDSHISSVTGESVFNIFVDIPRSDGNPSLYLVKEYRTREIDDQFTLSFYDNTGFSYLVNNEGFIQVRSEHKNSNKTAFNLFDMVSEKENDKHTLELFKKSIRELHSGWAKFSYKGTGMVFCYEPLQADFDWLLISIVPESVILKQTNSVLQKTLLFSGSIIGIIVIIILFFYKNKMRETQEHTRKLQQALNAADQANRAKGYFLMNMSHDIRTPLNAIIGMTAIAQENISDRDKTEDCLEKIRISGTHLLSLVNDVLDMSQIDDGKLSLKEEPVCFPQLFKEITDLIKFDAQEAGLSMELAPVCLKNNTIAGDPLRIRQVMINIINNAIKYTPSGGHIYLELFQPEDAREDYGIYRFVCRDTGIGMDGKFLERVFQPFERNQNTTDSKIAGAGVGLSITKGLLDLMGGSISAESELGKGSSFTVDFRFRVLEDISRSPAFSESSKDDCAARPEEEPDYSDKRILLVEDNDLNMEIAEELIGMTGVQIEKAYDGQQAVQMFREKPCGYYNLIFMDIQMPVMNGYEATRQIRMTKRDDAEAVPIYAMSANAFAEDVENSLKSGMNGHIAKPINMDPIEKVMQQHLR